MQQTTRGRRLLGMATAWVLVGLHACGGGSGSAAPPPPAASSDLGFLSGNLNDQTVTVPSDATFLYSFDTDVAAAGAGDFVTATDSQGAVPLTVDVLAGSLRVRAAQGFRLRSDHTVTVKAGLKATNGATLRADIVRRFRTVLFEATNQVVIPSTPALQNYPGQYMFRLADVNGDGRLDVVQIGGDAALIRESNSFAINVYRQEANRSFARIQNLLVHESQHSYLNAMGDLAVVDLDYDGRQEIVVAINRVLPGQNGLMVFKQDTQGQYGLSAFMPTDYAYKLFVTDLNGDGKPDLLSIGQGIALTDGPNRCGMVAVLSSPSGAQMQPSTLLPCERYEATLGSLDATGSLHLVLIRPSFTVPREAFSPRLRIYRLDARGVPSLDSGLMSAASTLASGFLDCTGLMIINVGGDGVPDLMFRTCYVDDRTVTSVVYTRGTRGTFTEWARPLFDGYATLVADLDKDGLDDVMSFLGDFFTGTYVAGGFGRPGGGFEFTHRVPVSVLDTPNQDLATVADLDGDGLPDILVSTYNTGLSVLFQRRPR